jgi:hypothetical protein
VPGRFVDDAVRVVEWLGELWRDRTGVLRTRVLQELAANLRRKVGRPLDGKATRDMGGTTDAVIVRDLRRRGGVLLDKTHHSVRVAIANLYKTTPVVLVPAVGCQPEIHG